MLVMLCMGTALTRVVNAGAQEGLEAWRALVLHHEPTSLTRSAGLLQELLNFSFEFETAARMAQFYRHIDRCEKASGETFPENIRIGVALRMLPDGSLKRHFVLNSARLTTWETPKAEIENVRCAGCCQFDLGVDVMDSGMPCRFCGHHLVRTEVSLTLVYGRRADATTLAQWGPRRLLRFL